jgi:hypothetical protein
MMGFAVPGVDGVNQKGLDQRRLLIPLRGQLRGS